MFSHLFVGRFVSLLRRLLCKLWINVYKIFDEGRSSDISIENHYSFSFSY